MDCECAGHPPVGATTHYPQRNVFSAPILDHHPRSDQTPSEQQQQQAPQQPAQSNTVQSQSVHLAQSVPPTHSQSVHTSQSGHPTQSGQQPSAVAIPVESAGQQEASSRIKSAAPSFQQPESTVSLQQPSTQTPFNVVTSGESGHILPKQRPSSSSAAADKQRMGPPAVDGFNAQISPFVAQSEHSLHIQHAPNPHGGPANDASPHKNFNSGLSSRSGSYTYGSNYPQSSFIPSGSGQANQDLSSSHCYAPANMQSHLSSQGSAGFNTMPQYQYQPQQQMQQQSMQSWPGYEEVRTSPRHPGAWHWSDGIGQGQSGMGQSHMDGLNHSGSNNWESQQAQSSQFSMPSQPDWQDPQAWRQQQSNISGAVPFGDCLSPCCRVQKQLIDTACAWHPQLSVLPYWTAAREHCTCCVRY